jgi:hypothetical protein
MAVTRRIKRGGGCCGRQGGGEGPNSLRQVEEAEGGGVLAWARQPRVDSVGGTVRLLKQGREEMD